eukprot:6489266-Pyramimonas_sp.AAC.1
MTEAFLPPRVPRPSDRPGTSRPGTAGLYGVGSPPEGKPDNLYFLSKQAKERVKHSSDVHSVHTLLSLASNIQAPSVAPPPCAPPPCVVHILWAGPGRSFHLFRG